MRHNICSYKLPSLKQLNANFNRPDSYWKCTNFHDKWKNKELYKLHEVYEQSNIHLQTQKYEKTHYNWFGCHLWFNPVTTSLLRWRLSSKNYWQTLKANFLNKEICNLKNIIKCSYPNKHFFSNNFNLRTERTRIMKSLVWLFSLSISVSKESPRFALQFI